MHATCATTDCTVPQECGGEAAASCAAFTITLFGGRDIAGGPICATCAGYRWTSLAVIAPTTVPADTPCANCTQRIGATDATPVDAAPFSLAEMRALHRGLDEEGHAK